MYNGEFSRSSKRFRTSAWFSGLEEEGMHGGWENFRNSLPNHYALLEELNLWKPFHTTYHSYAILINVIYSINYIKRLGYIVQLVTQIL